MSLVQSMSCPTRGIILFEPNARSAGNLPSVYQIPCLKAPHLYAMTSCKFRQHKLQGRLVYNAPKNERCVSVRSFSKKGDYVSKNEEVFKKATDGFRSELTVQDLLRDYAKAKGRHRYGGRTFFGWGGGGGNIFGWGGGGGNFFGWGGGHDSGDSKGEGFAAQFDELLQVIMATIGVIILYLLITSTNELTRLARDYIKYLNGAKPSTRMVRFMEKWRCIYDTITGKENVE